MLLSSSQQAMFWRLWKGACAAQGWFGGDQEIQRKAVLQDLGFSSLRDVGTTSDFDRVKARLLTLQDRLDGASEEVFPAVAAMRRHIHIISTQLEPALSDLVDDPDGYIRAICRDKFHQDIPWRSLAAHPQRGPAQIEQLLVTLTRCLYALGWRAPSKSRRKPSPLDKPLGNSVSTPLLDKPAPTRAPGDPS